MIKFKTPKDKEQFLTDINKLEHIDTPEDDLPIELSELFFKKNKQRTGRMVDFRKSQTSKRQWRTNKWDMMKGIHKFHRSIEGKRFHRSLGRFLATRTFNTPSLKALPSLRTEAAKAVSSVRTHLYIESQYYKALEDDVDFELLMEYALPLLLTVECKIYEGEFEAITEDELELLYRITELSELKKAYNRYDDGKVIVESLEQLLESTDLDAEYALSLLFNV